MVDLYWREIGVKPGAICVNAALSSANSVAPAGPSFAEIKGTHTIKLATMSHGTELTSTFPEALEYDGSFGKFQINSNRYNLIQTLKGSDILLANSVFTKQIVQNICPNANIHVTGCGVTHNMLKHNSRIRKTLKEKAVHRHSVGLNPGPTIAFCGRLVPHKNVMHILQFIKEHSNWNVIIIGDGPELANLQTFSKLNDLLHRTKFMGFVDEATKFELISMSDYLFLPSSYSKETGGYEGFGIVALEALTCGTIPVVSGAEGTSDLINPFQLAIPISQKYDGRIEENLRKRLEGLLENEDLYRQSLNNALQNLSDDLTWDRIAEKIWRRIQ